MDTPDSTMQTTQLSEIEQLEMKLKEASLTGSQTTDLFFDLGWAYHKSYMDAHHGDALETAIKYYESGLKHEPLDEDCHGLLLINLGNILVTRFEQLGEIKDLVKAITYHERALALHTPGHPNRTMSLTGLANALDTRFWRLGKMRDLEEVITYREEALSLCPPGHPHRSIFLNNLANALDTRFWQLGDIGDLEKAIAWHEEGLDLRPSGHPSRSSSLMNLANALQTRFQQLGDMKDLEKAINFHQQALELRPPGHSDRPSSLMNLANALKTRFQQLGERKDLEQAITCYEQALEFRPPGHPDRASFLINLANSLKTRFDLLGEIRDLEAAITFHEEALMLCPPGHPTRSKSLMNLANVYLKRFDQLGEMRDLEEAITCYEQALALCPPGHPDRPPSLMNLANGLNTKFQQLGEMKDLDEAIKYHVQALELCPSSHSDRLKYLNNLANALETRFWQIGKIKDLEEVIFYHHQAISLIPSGHTERPSSLNNLATALKTRGEHLGEIKDLEEAIAYHKQALDLHPPGHPNRFISLMGLANALLSKFEPTGNLSDLESATAGYKATLLCLSPHHPFHCSVFSAQATLETKLHSSAWVTCNNCSHIDEACRLFELAAHHATSSLQNRFTAAKKWASAAHRHQHKSATSAYAIALDLQQQYLALFPSVISQQKLMKNSIKLSLNAASCAISEGKSEMAVQLLEQGRSILWSKIQGYRQPFEDLSEKDPKLATEVRTIGHQLEHNAVSIGIDIELQHELSKKWGALLEKIRELEGYSGYLQAIPFKSLQDATKEGPVIMVNISDFRSDAIILIGNAPPIIVALHDASPERLEQLVNQLSQAATGARPSQGVVKVLQHLWDIVIEPVANQLAQLQVPEKSRIWWCPTSYLCALPLHAAGPYRKGCKNMPDLYVSSYMLTLASLIRGRSHITKPQPISTLLLVSQPDSTIPQVLEETRVIKSFGKEIDSCSGQDAVKEAVLAGLQSHSWVHFACHGHLEEQPFNSWFQLHNREHLTILDLAKTQLPNAEFAFLSACHSAAGNIYETPDESIHLAAALQFCGFRSVIGTLWAMVDDDGPAMADAFYKHMFRNADTMDLRDAAVALNIATRELRKQHVPLDQWINFIHIGA